MTEKTVEGDVSETAKTELIVAEAAANPVALFTDEKRYSEFYQRIKEEVSKFEPDLSTDTGRKKVASLAFRVTKAKTTLDKAGLALTEQWRRQTAEVTTARKKMVSELDALAAEVRKPLTDWEEAEAARQRDVDERIAAIRAKATVEDDETAADVEARGRELYECQLDPDLFRDRLEEAQQAKEASVAALVRIRDRLRREEADRAELERLRKEQEEREAREAEEREKREAAEREKAERERKEREETARREAEERRIAEAEERAREAAAAEERKKAAAALQDERDRADAAEAAAREAREREEERQRIAEKEEADRKRREADKAHRGKLAGEAKADLMELGVEEELARKIVLAIAAREVRHISITF